MPVIETERMLVHRDEYFHNKWMIRPLSVSELWVAALGPNWDIEFSEAHEFEFLYERLVKEWDSASQKSGDDILICEVEVEYWFTPPPGLRSLRYGTYSGASRDEFWYIKGGGKTYRKVVGGFVRAINMVPLSEREHDGRRDQGQEPGRVSRVKVL